MREILKEPITFTGRRWKAGIDVYDRVTYVVQKGEYITQLARKYNSTVEAILAANGLTDASKVTENRVLVIPSLPSAGTP